MATRYQVRVKAQNGALVAILTNWVRLTYTKQVNKPDTHELVLAADEAVLPDILLLGGAAFQPDAFSSGFQITTGSGSGGSGTSQPLFILDGQLEIWRRDIAATPQIPWMLDYEGFHRTSVFETTESGRRLFHSFGRGYLDLVGRRAVLYPSGSAGASKTGPGETIIKAFVDENAGPSATSPPRSVASGVTPGLTIEADAGTGTVRTFSRAWRNLLDVIHEIAHCSEVDFEVVGTGPATFEFRARPFPLGADRTTVGLNPLTGLNAAGNTPMIFSLDFGNMQAPSYSFNRIEEVTAAIALGQGLGVGRELFQEIDSHITDSPWNRRELTRQANMESATSGLEAVAVSTLHQFAQRENFSFRVLQTPARLYGRDYFVGDLVTARYNAIEQHLQITGATVTVAGGREDIDIALREHAV